MSATCSDIRQALAGHLTAQLEVSQIRDMCVVTLPIYTLDKRWVDVFIEPRVTDFFLIHDGGKAANELILNGITITDSIERQLGSVAGRFGVAFSDEMFQTGAKFSNLAQAVNAVGMCSALAMTHLLETLKLDEQSTVDEQMLTILKRWGKGRATVREGVRVAGHSKQHQFDFTVTPEKDSRLRCRCLIRHREHLQRLSDLASKYKTFEAQNSKSGGELQFKRSQKSGHNRRKESSKDLRIR